MFASLLSLAVVVSGAPSAAAMPSAAAIKKASDSLGSPLPFVRSHEPNSVRSIILIRSARYAKSGAQMAQVTAGACGGTPVQRGIEVRNAPPLHQGELLMVVLLNADRPNEFARWGVRKATDIEQQDYARCVR